jgi:ribosome recycling factor
MNQSLSLITDKNKQQIKDILDSFEKYLRTIKTGRVTPHLLDNIYIMYNKKKTKIAHLSNIEVNKHNVITISPWEKKYLKLIEKSILEAPSNLSLNNNGKQILIKVLPITKIDRENILKDLKKQGEKTKVSIRQARRNNNNLIKTCIKKNNLSSSLDKVYLKTIQKQTDDAISHIDHTIEIKKKDIITI